MSYAIAAAGTGGHVYPGLAVGQALVASGVPPDEILFVGGERLEAKVYPEAGFPFEQVELRGLERRLTLRNLTLPAVVVRAVRQLADAFTRRQVRAVLGMGGYVTVPAGLAARRAGAALAVAEQNAEAGLANRVIARLARRRFGAFPHTRHLPGAEWVGNPVRAAIADFDRDRLRPEALNRYGLDGSAPVLGVFGGSLGAAAINRAVAEMLTAWSGPELAVVHLTGERHLADMTSAAEASPVPWRVIGFEDRMDLFYAATDLAIARSGGAVAELTATATPAVLIPGGFGSAGHQAANAAALVDAGAARMVPESSLDRLADVVEQLIADPDARARMARGSASLARPDAARTVAAALGDMHG